VARDQHALDRCLAGGELARQRLPAGSEALGFGAKAPPLRL